MSAVATDNLTVFGSPVFENALEQIKELMRDPRAVKGALMADHHHGYSMPIGGVVAYDETISPSGVGFDIGCGCLAVRTNVQMHDLVAEIVGDNAATMANEPSVIVQAIQPIMREIRDRVAFGIGRKNATPFEHPVLEREQAVWGELEQRFGPELHKKAAEQLGTVGSGNHYVDLLVDEFGYLWIATHFGSRGLGHTIASGFMAAARGLTFRDRIPESEEAVLLDTRKDLGQFYIEAMGLSGRYAYAGREHVVEQVLAILGAMPTATVHNHHNFAWYENGLWVVRKGATPLTEDHAFIGGSMGDDSYIVHGKVPQIGVDEADDMYASLYSRVADLGNVGSAPHGAGRVMTRTQAAGKLRNMWICNNRDCDYMTRKLSAEHVASGEAVEGRDGSVRAPEECPECHGTAFRKQRARDASTASIDWRTEHTALAERGVVVIGAGADESPGVYKQLAEVVGHHQNIEVVHRLTPIGVAMAGSDESARDPYSD